MTVNHLLGALRLNIILSIVGIPLLNACSVQGKSPNILLIITDQHPGLFMTQAGYPYIETPGIDKIAETGVMYTRSYCTYPFCLASRASIMTGMMPGKSKRNLTSYPGIGKTLHDSGYETGYFGKWHVASSKMDEVGSWRIEPGNKQFSIQIRIDYPPPVSEGLDDKNKYVVRVANHALNQLLGTNNGVR